MIKIDQDKCVGCSACAGLCPGVFQMNSTTGKAEVIIQDAGSCDMEHVINSCPVGAISDD